MTRAVITLVVLLVLASYGMYCFNRDVVGPALSRLGARLIGCSVAEYEARRDAAMANFWDRLLKR